jgi:hypothetical protein
MICVYSNSDVDAVFAKVVTYARKHHEECFGDDSVRLNATSIEDGLIAHLTEMQDMPNDANSLGSKVAAENVEFTVAYKGAKWMMAHPFDPVTINKKAWQDALERQQANSEVGMLRKPREAKEPRSLKIFQLQSKVIDPDKAKLVGCMSAGGRHIEEKMDYECDIVITTRHPTRVVTLDAFHDTANQDGGRRR